MVLFPRLHYTDTMHDSTPIPRESTPPPPAPSRPLSRRLQVVGGIEQHDEFTPVELLWLTPRRTKMLLHLLDGPQRMYSEALLYFARVGLAQRNEHGEYSLTEPRGRELAERIRACKPPCRGGKY